MSAYIPPNESIALYDYYNKIQYYITHTLLGIYVIPLILVTYQHV